MEVPGRRALLLVSGLLLSAWAVATAVSAGSGPVSVVLGPVAVGLVLWGRAWPWVALPAAFGALLLAVELEPSAPEDPYLALVVLANFLVGRCSPLRYQPWAAAGVLLLLSINVFEPGRDVAVADVVFPVIFTAAPWLLGLSVKVADERAATARAMAEDVRRARDRDVRVAAAEERLRIAREMHDVVAHTISAVSLQAQAARLKAAAGQSVDPEELRAIESSAREAMTEMRGLLGVLRADNHEPGGPLAPASGLDDLDRLVAEGRRAGQDIRFDRAGEPRPVAPFVDTTAYRIAQEALTNARKHGTGTTHLTVSQHDGVVAIEVDNRVADPYAPVDAVDADEGHGLIGLRERVTMLGGDLEVGRVGDRWRLRAVLPTAGPPRE